MAKIWYRLIQKRLKNITDVPEKYKDEVQALLGTNEESEV